MGVLDVYNKVQPQPILLDANNLYKIIWFELTNPNE